MTTIPEYLFFAYFAMAFIKMALCAPSIGVAVNVLIRLNHAKPSKALEYAVMVPALVGVLVLATWPLSLIVERTGFFLMYRTKTVIRQCVAGHRMLAKV